MRINVSLLLISSVLAISSCSPTPLVPAATSTPVVPSKTPLPTLTFTPEPTATSTPGPQGLCANVLVPLLPGYGWVYTSSDTINPSRTEITVTTVDQLANIVADIHIQNSDEGYDFKDKSICDTGAVRNFPFIFLRMLLRDYIAGNLEIYHVSGVYVPSFDTLLENGWNFSWDLVEMLENETKVNQSAVPNQVYLMKGSNITVHSELAADREAVTIPLGSFPMALVVHQVITFPVTMWTVSSSMLGDFTVNTTQWYEPYTGLLKMQVDSADISFVEGIAMPVPIESTIILTEFHTGN